MNDISFNGGINVNDYNYSVNVDSQALPNGFYKLSFKDVGDVKPARSGCADGAIFTFVVLEGPYQGATFNVWFAVNQHTFKGAGLVRKFKTIFARIAQAVNVNPLTSVAQLIDKPFFAFVRQTTSKRVILDDQTGEERTETTYNNEFGAVPADSILSIADYYRANPPSDETASFVKLGGEPGAAKPKKAAETPEEEDSPF